MNGKIYRGKKTESIVFPIGGIGSGSIGLTGTGRFMDWEIFNRPNKGSINGFSSIAVKAVDAKTGMLIDVRVLNGDFNGSFIGNYSDRLFSGYGFGPDHLSMAGLPHFEKVEFINGFPIAHINFSDRNFPAKVSLMAFNPFIPLNSQDSSIPAAFLSVHFENNTSKEIRYEACLSVKNPAPAGNSKNRKICDESFNFVRLENLSPDKFAMDYGDITIGTDSKDASVQEYWYRGRWFDSINMFWHDFSSPGKLKERSYDNCSNRDDTASVSGLVQLEPEKDNEVRFIISWNYPNVMNYWNALEPKENTGYFYDEKKRDLGSQPVEKRWRNYYSTIFENSVQSAVYGLKNWDRLYKDTYAFQNTLFFSSLPEAMLDAVASNLAILKSPTCMRLTDGSFYGFEGCHSYCGSCEGSCTHVWNYAYALPFLFPDLERSMRDLDYEYCSDSEGGMYFRLQLPLEKGKLFDHRPCVDGQMGGIIKVYRDWKICGDNQWMAKLWPQVKKSLEFAWSDKNVDYWDIAMEGVITGRQHNTLDLELFGPNAWLTGFYLGALKAAGEMAEFLDDKEFASKCRELYKKGRVFTDKNLFNGEYFIQKIDLNDKKVLEGYDCFHGRIDDDAVNHYWDGEVNQIKYQMADGCAIDQVLADWHGRICGLGEVFDSEQTLEALKAIYRYNFKNSVRNLFNPCRLYALDDEGGTVLCSWPEGTIRPIIPALYTDEVWTGCEYQYAAHLILMGRPDMAEEIVRTARDRYDGEKRNPLSEMECGSSYARAMSSYTLLLAYSGFTFDSTKGLIGFAPVIEGDFQCFWCLNTGWGNMELNDESFRLSVSYGMISFKQLALPKVLLETVYSVNINNSEIFFQICDDKIIFSTEIELCLGDTVSITFKEGSTKNVY